MSLRTDYNIQDNMITVYDLGVALIQSTPTPAYTQLSTELANAAAAGKRDFTINVAHNADDTNLKLNGDYLNSYKAGIYSALAAEEIYSHQVTVELNTVQTTASIDLTFSF